MVIQHLHSIEADKKPNKLELGEVAINNNDGKIFIKNSTSNENSLYEFASTDEISKSIENITDNLIPQVYYVETKSDIYETSNLSINSIYRADSKNDLIDCFRTLAMNPVRSTLLTIVQFKFRYNGIDTLATLYPCKREVSKLTLFGDAGIVSNTGTFLKKISLLIIFDKNKPENEFTGRVINEITPS